MRNVGLVYDDAYLDHILAPGHPESPDRLDKLIQKLKASGLSDDLQWYRPFVSSSYFIKCVHSDYHRYLVENQARNEAICRLAVSGVLSGINKVMTKQCTHAFCAVRPPGHHADCQGEFGFCFYSNVALGAYYAQKHYGLDRILIVDWDYHHGNGTENLFYDDPSVFFFSTHNLNAFPGTGRMDEIGTGDGEGYTLNVPLASGASDKNILNAFEHYLGVRALTFKPQLILVSAGFDSRKDDYLGDFRITDQGFTALTRLLLNISDHHQCPIVSVLEGGYNPEGVASSAKAHLQSLLDD